MLHALRHALPAAACALLLTSGATAGNLVVNGSFETGPVVNQFIDLPAGSTAIAGWTVGGFHIDYAASTTWNASDGSHSVDLDGSVATQPRNGSIFQSFATTPGQQYKVTFDLSGNTSGAPTVKQLEVSAGNAVQVYSCDIGTIVAYVPPLVIVYKPQTFLFTATSTMSTLTFKSLTQLGPALPGYGAVIDNVCVEPASPWTDLGFALAGVAGLPQLVGTGPLTAGSSGSIVLSHAAPSAPSLLFIALAAHPTPFKCGTLLPVPWVSTFALGTSPAGGIPLGWAAWPAGLSGLSLHFQYAVKDNAGICGVSLSNAVRGNVP